MPAEENPLGLGHSPGFLASAADLIHSPDRQLMFFLRRPPCFLPTLGEIGEEQIPRHGEWERDDAVDDKEPSPAGTTLHLM